MKAFIHQSDDWPNFTWQLDEFINLLSEVRNLQGRILGRMEALGFDLRTEATLETLTLDVLKSSEIEGEYLNPDQVRSSIARLMQTQFKLQDMEIKPTKMLGDQSTRNFMPSADALS